MKTKLEQCFSFPVLFLFLFFLFCCTTCSSTYRSKSNHKQQMQNHFDWQGHRGARGLAPENTLPSFLKALEFPKIQTLELDLAVSADNQIVVSHEPWMSAAICSTPDGTPVKKEDETKLLLYKMSYAEIAQYDCGKRGNAGFPEQQAMPVHKPLLKDVVEGVKAYCKQHNRPLPRINVEIKSDPNWDGQRIPAPAELAKMVVQEIKALDMAKFSYVQSFDPRVLREVRAIDPKMMIALLVGNPKGMDANVQELGFQPAIYSPHYGLVKAEDVQKAHTLGMKVIPWTVNETAEMQKLIAMGVDGIITDYPNRIPADAK